MRDSLPKKPRKNECGIMNLDNQSSNGTHWVSWIKNNDNIKYFDSFGNLRPSIEFVNYMGKFNNIFYNYNNHQTYDSIICGHLCLQFLYENLMNK